MKYSQLPLKDQHRKLVDAAIKIHNFVAILARKIRAQTSRDIVSVTSQSAAIVEKHARGHVASCRGINLSIVNCVAAPVLVVVVCLRSSETGVTLQLGAKFNNEADFFVDILVVSACHGCCQDTPGKRSCLFKPLIIMCNLERARSLNF